MFFNETFLMKEHGCQSCVIATLYHSVFQPFSSGGTSQKFIIIWRNLNAPNSTIYRIFREPSKELAEPLGSAEPRLKNTALSNSCWDTRNLNSLSAKIC
jgi:hypothetical protein